MLIFNESLHPSACKYAREVNSNPEFHLSKDSRMIYIHNYHDIIVMRNIFVNTKLERSDTIY